MTSNSLTLTEKINNNDVAYFVDNSNGIIYNFPFNVNSLNWNYSMNSQSYDTIGGRVTQLLSVQTTTIVLQGDAGTRANLISLYENFKTLQDSQNQTKIAPTLSVPSRALSWTVWLEQMRLGWDTQTVTYPYFMTLEVETDITNVGRNTATVDALNRIINGSGGIGFNGNYNGTASANAINVNLPS